MTQPRYRFEEHYNVRDFHDLPTRDVEGIKQCISSGFAGGIREDDAYAHMSGDQIIVVKDTHDGLSVSGGIVGFTSTLVVSPHDLFGYDDVSRIPSGYFAGAALDARHQQQGLYGRLFSERFNYVRQQGVESIFTRTQNPAVLRGMMRGVEHLVEIGEIRAFRFGQRVCERAYYGRLKTDMKAEFPYINTDAGDALLFTWDLNV